MLLDQSCPLQKITPEQGDRARPGINCSGFCACEEILKSPRVEE